jgi:hypothetical protein
MPIPKPKLLNRLRDPLQFLPVNRNIDILSRTPAPGPPQGNLKKNRKPSHYAILNSRRIKRGMKPFDPLKKPVHVSIVGAGSDHSQFYFRMTLPRS